MPVFKYTGEPAIFNWFFTRGQEVELVFPGAELAEGSYTEERVQGITQYTVVDAFDLTGMTFAASIGTRGGAEVCPITVTHNGTGGEITISITQADSEATPSGTYTWELVDLTSDSKAPLFEGTVRVKEGVVAR